MKTIIPAGYQQVMPYILVKDAPGFLKFMVDVFGAAERLRHMRDEHTIAHAEVALGDSTIMVAEALEAYPVCNSGMFVYVGNSDEVYAKAMAAGSESVMPVSDQSYGRSGGVKDPYGNTWWITTALQG